MKSSFCIDLQRFMLIPTKFPLSKKVLRDTCQSITYYFAKYHVILAKVSLDAFLGFIFLLTFSLAYLLYLSFFIAQKDTYLIFYL